MNKKTLGIFISLTIILSILITACGAGNTAKDNTASSQRSKDTVTLSFLTNYDSNTKQMLEEKFASYLEKNNVKISMTVSPSDQFPTILQTQVAAGDPPDLSNTWPGLPYVIAYARAGHLLDMSDRPWVSDLVESIKETVSYQDKLYGLPIGMDVVGVFYRKDLFKSMGLNVPKTYEDFLQVCETIKSKGKIPIAVGAKTIWAPQFMPMYTFCNNVVYSKDRQWDNKLLEGKVKFSTTEGWKKSFEMFMELSQKGYFEDNPLGVTIEQELQLFENGDALMIVDGTWTIPTFSSKDAANNYGFFAMPAPQGYETTVPIAGGGSCLQAYVKTKYKDQVRKFFDFMASEEMVRAICTGSRLSTFKSIKIELPENYAEIIPDMEKANYPFTNTTWVGGIQDALQKGYQELLAGGGRSIDDMLKEVDVTATRNIAEYKK